MGSMFFLMIGYVIVVVLLMAIKTKAHYMLSKLKFGQKIHRMVF